MRADIRTFIKLDPVGASLHRLLAKSIHHTQPKARSRRANRSILRPQRPGVQFSRNIVHYRTAQTAAGKHGMMVIR
jgi:hypothetical protein